jgi:hypothetical protein
VAATKANAEHRTPNVEHRMEDCMQCLAVQPVEVWRSGVCLWRHKECRDSRAKESEEETRDRFWRSAGVSPALVPESGSHEKHEGHEEEGDREMGHHLGARASSPASSSPCSWRHECSLGRKPVGTRQTPLPGPAPPRWQVSASPKSRRGTCATEQSPPIRCSTLDVRCSMFGFSSRSLATSGDPGDLAGLGSGRSRGRWPWHRRG